MSGADQTAGTVQCLLCPHGCIIEPGQRGTCGVRANIDGELVSLVYGRPVAVHVDPIEKKPLYHFQPGSGSFSIATVGCNLGCRFCQNWEISQALPEDVPPYELPPERVVDEALRYGCSSISYTYTEPIIFYEYMFDTATLARQSGLKNVMVTAGYINQGPLEQLATVIDAVNVDLKAMSDRYYREMCYGTLEPVLRTILTLVEAGVWVELTNLVIPGWNDSEEDITALVDWVLSEIGSSVPLHFSRFMPMYQLTELPPTPVETLSSARSAALSAGMSFVYVGNVVTAEGSHTFCPGCGRRLIARQGYLIDEMTLTPEGNCPDCGEPIPGVWSD